MTAALLAAALAMVLWPDPRAQRWRRAVLLGRPARRAVPRPTHGLPVPLVAALAAAGVAAVLSTALVALLAGVVALVGARSWVTAGRDRAEDGRLAGLAEGLGALAAELRSGRALEPATDAAVTACGTDEGGRVLARAVRVPEPASRPPGAPAGRDDPVSSAADRLSAAVLLSTRTGCSLADVVAAVDEDLRARRRHWQELRSAVAAPRASAALLAGLPLLGLAMGSGIGADPWRVLTATGTGQVLLVTGVALELAGLAWSARLTERALR